MFIQLVMKYSLQGSQIACYLCRAHTSPNLMLGIKNPLLKIKNAMLGFENPLQKE
jgi:hypothetical protein